MGVVRVAGVVGTSLDHLADFSPQAPAVLAATPAPTPPRGRSEGPETQLGAAIPTYIPETRPSPPPSTPSPSRVPRAGSRGKLGVAVVGTLVALGVVGGVLGRSRPSTDASVAARGRASALGLRVEGSEASRGSAEGVVVEVHERAGTPT